MKTIRKITVLLSLLAIPLFSIGQNQFQFECSTIAEEDHSIRAGNCAYNDIFANEIVNYAFIPTANSPIYTVRLNLHIMQEDDGSGNFQDTPEDRAFLQQLIDGVNYMYGNSPQPICDGVVTENYIVDIRIRFRIDGIFFHRNSPLAPICNRCVA